MVIRLIFGMRFTQELIGCAAITNAMTRMRICTAHGELEFKFKGELKDIPAGYMPWFDVPTRQSQEANCLWTLVSPRFTAARKYLCPRYRLLVGW